MGTILRFLHSLRSGETAQAGNLRLPESISRVMMEPAGLLPLKTAGFIPDSALP